MTRPETRADQQEAIGEALYRALTKYEQERRSMRNLRMALGGRGPTIKRGTARGALARYLAAAAVKALEDDSWQ